ncbi:MAG: hypothetical protein ETSY1_33835 [Candidatus Entotheonella factor]|uniref:Uncharacterized protein n=1 Tax=Entotheonella factor TaxID=1429438 RepID=W4L9A7_ENTF1|nr:MAG: hypothetical protein ETSY1_33835 [Candidatus Entotheonella factor]
MMLSQRYYVIKRYCKTCYGWFSSLTAYVRCNLKQSVSKSIDNELGLTAIEYSFVIFVVTAIAIAFLGLFEPVQDWFLEFIEEIEKVGDRAHSD